MSTVTYYICLGEYIPNTVTIFNPEVAVLANVYILDNILLASRFPARIVSDDLDDCSLLLISLCYCCFNIDEIDTLYLPQF